MTDYDKETINEMNAPDFKEYDPNRLWVIVRKDYEEGSRAMWREYERFSTKEEARKTLSMIRENQNSYEDRTGYESLISYKIVKEK